MSEVSDKIEQLETKIIPVSQGGTGATTTEEALENLGALPLTGGTLSGTNLFFGDGYGSVGAISEFAVLGHYPNKYTDGCDTSYLAVSDAVELSHSMRLNVVRNKVTNGYNIYGEHNVISSTVTLASSGWSNGYQTVSCASATATNNVMVSPAPDSFIAYGKAKVRCTAQSAGALTFACDTSSVPTINLVVNVITMGV